MAVNHYRRTRSAPKRHEAPVSSSDSQAADEKAAYTLDVLTQYRRYVSTQLEPELEALRSEAAELHYDVEMSREEIATLRHRAEIAEADAANATASLRDLTAASDARLRAATAHHDDHIDAVKQAAAKERDAMELRLRDAERVAEELRAAGGDPTLIRRLGAAEEARDAAESGRRVLQDRLKEAERLIASAENGRSALSAVQRQTGETALEIRGVIREATDFSASISKAFAHIECPCAELSGAASQWSAMAAMDPTVDPSSGEHTAQLVSQLRSGLQHQHAAIASALRELVVKHTYALESAASADHERQHERELARRRLAELEEDLRAERESMLQALERERVNARLSSSAAQPGAQARVDEQLSRRVQVPTSSASCQTGPELMSVHGEHDQAARLLDEVGRQQAELSHHRETIQLLEQQRRLFMDFVDDGFVAAHVHTALNGSMPSDSFMLHGAL
jgi:hypothetical protein